MRRGPPTSGSAPAMPRWGGRRRRDGGVTVTARRLVRAVQRRGEANHLRGGDRGGGDRERGRRRARSYRHAGRDAGHGWIRAGQRDRHAARGGGAAQGDGPGRWRGPRRRWKDSRRARRARRRVGGPGVQPSCTTSKSLAVSAAKAGFRTSLFQRVSNVPRDVHVGAVVRDDQAVASSSRGRSSGAPA